MFVFRKIPRFLILHDFSLGLEHQKQVVTGNNTSTGATYVHVRSTVYPQIGWNVAVCSKWAVFCVFFRINIWNIIMFQKTAFGLLPTDVHLRPIKQRHVWHIFIRLLQSFTCKNVLSTTKNFKYSSVSFKMRFLKRNKGCQGKQGKKTYQICEVFDSSFIWINQFPVSITAFLEKILKPKMFLTDGWWQGKAWCLLQDVKLGAKSSWICCL